ncbi:hypothetical protein MmiHf6_03780 [Methanimicrococcus hongohii]|uniref:YkgJ family cysteine cluster protein n=1 Tax=Methanimicrococcus hongohii TaxID=3028295 RepID=A0AA96UYP6_9EURY|nr:YkgJ family cysteine cluster protein [Methanimicrococcus sp. Hf6]WNY23079.1 hypothetical protein MmiHf6_03780 [Methanimicrococcus sp. Hf6]
MSESSEYRESTPDLSSLSLFVSNISKINSVQEDASVSLRVEKEIQKMKPLLSGKQKSMLKTVESAGFSCLECGKCCERAEDDNSVYILPEEIRKIETKGFSKENFILPLLPDFYEMNESENSSDSTDSVQSIDSVYSADSSFSFQNSAFVAMLQSLSEQTDEYGRIHTFGWMLQRKNDGSCIFLDSGSKKCMIYDVRPALCRTYPFFADENGVSKCVCEGLDSADKTDASLAKKLAEALQNRVISDQADYIQTSAGIKKVYEKSVFNSETGKTAFEERLKNNAVMFVVYDGAGV